MNNELLLILSILFIYTCVVLFYRFLGKTGLYCWTVLATIAANIEVLIVVDAFGMEQTLGNILFASTFLVTDILSETEGRQSANKAVLIGIITSSVFILISQSWLLYTPNDNDWAAPAIASVFSNTPRLSFMPLYRHLMSLPIIQSGQRQRCSVKIPKNFCGLETMAPH